MNKLLLLIKFELKTSKKQILGWTIGLSSIMALYMLMFEYVREIGISKLEAFPKELLQLFSIDSLNIMDNYTSYYGMLLTIILVIACVFVSIFGSNLIRNEEKTKSIEYKATLNISRSNIYLSKLITLIFSIIILLLCINIVAIIIGYIMNLESFNISECINIALYTSILPMFFGLISFSLAGISYKYGSSNICSAIVAFTYLTGYFTTFLEKDLFNNIKYLFPFQIFNSNEGIILDNTNILVLCSYLIISIIIVIIGHISYNKRNFNI